MLACSARVIFLTHSGFNSNGMIQCEILPTSWAPTITLLGLKSVKYWQGFRRLVLMPIGFGQARLLTHPLTIRRSTAEDTYVSADIDSKDVTKHIETWSSLTELLHYAWLHTCMCVRTYMHTSACMLACKPYMRIRRPRPIYLCTITHVYVHVGLCMHTCM